MLGCGWPWRARMIRALLAREEPWGVSENLSEPERTRATQAQYCRLVSPGRLAKEFRHTRICCF